MAGGIEHSAGVDVLPRFHHHLGDGVLAASVVHVIYKLFQEPYILIRAALRPIIKEA